MKNRIKTFVKNHDLEIAFGALALGAFGMSFAYLYQVGDNIALKAQLAERGKPLTFTFTDEFVDHLYKLNQED